LSEIISLFKVYLLGKTTRS